MDRHAQDYAAAAIAYAQAQAQQQQPPPPPPPQYGFHPQAQPPQYPHHPHAGPPYGAPIPQYPPQYPHAMPPQQQLYPHLPPHQQSSPYHAMGTPPQQPLHPYMQHPPPFESAPPAPAPPPADPELQKRIDKLVEYIAKNGPEFEIVIRDKQHDNPDYAFVFGGEGHAYYRYMLWVAGRPPYPPGSMHMMPPPMGPMMRGPPMHQPAYPQFYDQHQHYGGAHGGHGEYEAAAQSFKGLSGPLPADVAAELHDVLTNLNGTKESIKGAKTWFMQRAPFAPALAEALRERVFTLEDSERQLHIVFLVNDILFEGLQRRNNIQDLDNEAVAFQSVLGSMLARIYNNPQSQDDNQTRLEKILQFWGSKEVYDQETIANLEREMKGGASYPSAPRHVSPDPSTFSGSARPPSKWSSAPPEQENATYPVSAAPQSVLSAQFLPANQFPAGVYPPLGQSTYPGSTLAVQPSLLPQSAAPATTNDLNPPPYPLFPPGLIPGMVRKMQIGSGVPYSPLSPLDIPTVIPPSTVPESDILDRVTKFFKEIGEVNPSEGPIMKQGEPNDDYDDYERELPARKGGACIPPPASLHVNPETGMRADGTFDSKPGSSGRPGLGASAVVDPDEESHHQYGDVYSSYRKQRSTNYHSSMSSRSLAPR